MARAKKKTRQDDETMTQDAIEAEMAEIAEQVLSEEEDETETAETVTEETESEEGAEDLEITQEDVRLVEAILFASSSALTVGQIGERFPEDRRKLIPAILSDLQEQYRVRGVNLVQRESRWALRTATDLGDQLRLEKEQPKKFTRAAMETMAVIAYHQPVTRAEIENIRGVATSPGALDALMEAGWIKPGKRREVPGRPVTWLTTQVFLDHFGLEKLEDLPGMDELKAAGLLDKRPAIEAMPTADLFDEAEDKEMEDPQEVTDEDLIGRQDDENTEIDDEEDETVMSTGGDEDEDDGDEDFDDEDEDEDSDDDSDDDDESGDDGDSDDEDDDDFDDEDDEDEEDDE